MAYGGKFLLLLLKNLKIKSRNRGGTAVEAIFPLICLALILGLYILFSRGADSQPNFSTRSIPSVASTLKKNSLAYGPNIESIRSILAVALDGRTDLLYPCETENEMDVILNQQREALGIFAGVYFRLTEEDSPPFGALPDNATYTIRVPGQFLPNPAILTKFTSNSNISPNLQYLSFLSIQQRIDKAIVEFKIKEKLGAPIQLEVNGTIGRFPIQIGEVDLDSRWEARNVIIKPVGGTWFTFCLLFTVYRLVSTIMIEKKTKVRDSMKMMGMRNEFYWLTWFLVSLLMTAPILIVCSLLLKFLNIFPRSSFDVIFLTWFLYGASLIAFAMLFSSFLNSTKSSGIITILAVVVLSIAGAAVTIAPMDSSYKIVMSLFSPVAYNLVVNILASAENLKLPMSYSYASDTIDGLPSLYSMIGMLVCDTVVYLVLAWYIDNITSSGAKQPWNFCFKGSYWGRKTATDTVAVDEESLEDIPLPNAADFEKIEGLGEPVIRVNKLHKDFDLNGRNFTAVEGFKLDMYEGQLVSLLGHNGAGKTTLISMLTGTVDPTSGDAEIYGHSLTKDLSGIKKIIGICPQHDAIWPQLTVYEHLQLFAGFKGVPFNTIKSEAEQVLRDFEVEDKRDYPAGKLSGGQKRKLMIAIALIGRSKVVFLDEPTSGMDPEARRTVWDLLAKYKTGRVIILTTHFMDEADYLGDRIAIMRHGKLLTAGSSLFLKQRFGLGYTLTCVKKLTCDVKALVDFLNSTASDISLLSNVGAEVIFRIPRSGLNALPELLKKLDEQKELLGLSTYGISQSTLEEVFLELNQESDQPSELNLNDTVFIPASESSKKRQLIALLHKRARFAKRDGKFLFIQFAVPIVTCIIAFIVQTFVFTPNSLSASEIAFDGNTYGDFITPWANNNCSSNYFSFLPQYSTDKFPEFSTTDLQQVLADPSTHASGSVINDVCESTPTVESLKYILLYNASVIHSLPHTQNLLSNALLNKILGTGVASITTISQPIGSSINIENNLISIIILFLILIGIGVLSASTTAYIFQEQELGVKQLQLSSGTDPIIYWLSNFIWDFVLHIIVFIIIFTVAAAINWTTFGGNRLGAEAVLVICYSLASVSIAYFMTFVFSGSGSGQGAALGLFIGAGFAFLVTIATTSAIIENSSDAPKILDYIFRALSPHYLFVLSFGQLANNVGTVNAVDTNSNLFDLSIWGSSYLFLIGQFIVYGALALVMENITKIRLANKKFRTVEGGDVVGDEEDGDVKNERVEVENANLDDESNNLIWVKSLRKEFNSKKKIRKVAVDNFSLHIPRGECFGLLGSNGAGKTTTLKMLSGQLIPTQGEVRVNGHSYRELDQIRKSIGFCPQFDSIIPKLSGRAHLELFAELRGLPKDQIPNIVNATIKMINLEKYADRPCGKYSSGNKRKLSLAIALIGNPPVLYLDEPSTGMDPLAKRFMWNLIMAVRSNKAIILTTHSMEECEALGTRLGIMIGGKLRCLGSPQHLKAKFGNGYRLDLKTDLQHVEEIPKFLEDLSPDARLVDHHTTMFNYEIPMKNLTLGQLFEKVESVKWELNIVDYAVSQTTLEQIFITMANEYNHNHLNTVTIDQ